MSGASVKTTMPSATMIYTAIKMRFFNFARFIVGFIMCGDTLRNGVETNALRGLTEFDGTS